MKIQQVKEEYRPRLKHPGGRPQLRLVAPKLFGKGGAEIYQGAVHKRCGTSMKYVSSGNCVLCCKQRDSLREKERKLDMWRRGVIRRQEAY